MSTNLAFVANLKSKTIHFKDCSYVRLMLGDNRESIKRQSLDDLKQGDILKQFEDFKGCKRCNADINQVDLDNWRGNNE